MTHRRAIVWTLLGCYWLTLISLTHLPPRLVPRVGVSDKTLHALAYGGLALCLYAALWVTFPRRRVALTTIALIALHGALDEWTQLLVGRTADPLDWVADLTGALLAVGLMLLVRRLALGPPLGPIEPAPPGKMYDIPPWSRRRH